MTTFALKNDNLVLEFNRANGALVSLSAVRTDWKILDRPQLGLSFRLLLPLSEERRNNPVYGEKQALSTLEVTPSGRCAAFGWDGITSEYGGKIDKSLFRLGLDWIRYALKRNLDLQPIFRFQPTLSTVNVR
jgi:hypothetical protein